MTRPYYGMTDDQWEQRNRWLSEGRRWRNTYWVVIYGEQRRHKLLWQAIFLLLFALIGIVMLVLPLFGKFARP